MFLGPSSYGAFRFHRCTPVDVCRCLSFTTTLHIANICACNAGNHAKDWRWLIKNNRSLNAPLSILFLTMSLIGLIYNTSLILTNQQTVVRVKLQHDHKLFFQNKTTPLKLIWFILSCKVKVPLKVASTCIEL